MLMVHRDHAAKRFLDDGMRGPVQFAAARLVSAKPLPRNCPRSGRYPSRIARYCPVPVKGRACGLPVLLSYTRKLADSAPTMEGVKYIVNVQTAPGASEPAQGGFAALLVKSRLLVPVMAQALK